MQGKAVWVALLAVLAVSLSWFSFSVPIEAAGSKRVEVVEFDTTIVFRGGGPSHIGQSLVFVRCWVAPEFFEEAVIWSEPDGRMLRMPLYPPTLRIYSDRDTLEVSHDIRPELSQRFPKPIQGPDVIKDMFGDYSVGNIRFAERAAIATRITRKDYTNLTMSGSAIELGRTRLPNYRGSENSEDYIAQRRAGTNRAFSLDIFDAQRTLLKSFGVFDNIERVVGYTQQVFLGEHNILAKLPGRGAKVRVEGETYQVQGFPMPYRKDGRMCTVERQQLRIGSQLFLLPVRVEERDPQGMVLRTATMREFHHCQLSPEEARNAGNEYAALTGPYKVYRDLLVSHWGSSPEQLSNEDLGKVRSVRDTLEDRQNQCDGVGELLRTCNAILNLDRLLGDTSHLKTSYREYLHILECNGFCEMVLQGGYGAIDTSLVWNRYGEATILMDDWLSAVRESCTVEAIAEFAEYQARNGESWAALQLAGTLSGWSDLSPQRALGIELTKIRSLEDLKAISDKKDLSGRQKAQMLWAASGIAPDELERRLNNSRIRVASLKALTINGRKDD